MDREIPAGVCIRASGCRNDMNIFRQVFLTICYDDSTVEQVFVSKKGGVGMEKVTYLQKALAAARQGGKDPKLTNKAVDLVFQLREINSS